jgi:hypothetical protein
MIKYPNFLKKAEQSKWDEADTQLYKSLDCLLTEAMLSAERQISRKVSTTYSWSPHLKRAIANLRYWKLCLKRVNGRTILDSILIRYQLEANIDVTLLPNPLRLPEVVTYLRQPRHNSTYVLCAYRCQTHSHPN